MRTRRRRNKVEWPAWRYSPDGEAKMFDKPEDVPEGWLDRKPQVFEAPEPLPDIDRASLELKLKDANVDIDPRWGKAKLEQVWRDIIK